MILAVAASSSPHDITIILFMLQRIYAFRFEEWHSGYAIKISTSCLEVSSGINGVVSINFGNSHQREVPHACNDFIR